MSAPIASPEQPAARNVLGIVALALAGATMLLDGAVRVLPLLSAWIGPGVITLAGASGMVVLVGLLAAAVCAILGLRHPRKATAAVALGASVAALVSFALWSGLFGLLLPLLRG